MRENRPENPIFEVNRHGDLRFKVPRLTWEEILNLHPSGWVELANCDWPDGEPHPLSAYICSAAPSKEELDKVACGPVIGATVRYLCVTDPKQNVRVVFWANLHQYRNPEAFGINIRSIATNPLKQARVPFGKKIEEPSRS